MNWKEVRFSKAECFAVLVKGCLGIDFNLSPHNNNLKYSSNREKLQ
jgi:hypothetical protein